MFRHVAAFAVVSVAALGTSVWLARRARLADLWIVPAYLVAANAIEYFVHRVLMHRPLWPRRLYRGHTLGHHRAFHHDSMEIDGWPELGLVLMPWFTVAIFFGGIGPVVALVAWGFGPGAAGLFLLTAAVTFAAYEGMHALYHFPLPMLGRLGLLHNRLFRFLHLHHQHHHRLARMRWANFNISMPLADRMCGTLESPRDWQAARERRRGCNLEP